MMNEGNFTKMKRWIIGISGIAIAYCSILMTKQGVGITGELAWMGTVIALSLFCAELMFNSNFDDLNWTILLLGLGAYVYSIWTNVEGFYAYRNIEGNLLTHFDMTNLGGGMFLDIYPELAIAWAMKESKIGDLLGNLVKTSKNPSKLTQPAQGQSKPEQSKAPEFLTETKKSIPLPEASKYKRPTDKNGFPPNYPPIK